jgi:hypothetical protein
LYVHFCISLSLTLTCLLQVCKSTTVCFSLSLRIYLFVRAQPVSGMGTQKIVQSCRSPEPHVGGCWDVMHATKPWYVLDSSTGTLGSRQRNGLAHFGDLLLKVIYLGDRFDYMFTICHRLVHSSKCPSSTVSNPARVNALASTIIPGDHDDHARGGPCSF